MSLSANNGGLSAGSDDLAALTVTSSAFQLRLEQLRDRQSAFEKALEDLNLGGAEKTAYEEANRLKIEQERATTAHNEALEADTIRHQADLQKWTAAAKAEYERKDADLQGRLAEAE